MWLHALASNQTQLTVYTGLRKFLDIQITQNIKQGGSCKHMLKTANTCSEITSVDDLRKQKKQAISTFFNNSLVISKLRQISTYFFVKKICSVFSATFCNVLSFSLYFALFKPVSSSFFIVWFCFDFVRHFLNTILKKKIVLLV